MAIPAVFAIAAEYLAPGIHWTTTAVALVGAAYMWAMVVQFEGSLHTFVTPIEQIRWSWNISTILPPMPYLRTAYIGSSLGIIIGSLEGCLFGYSMNLVFPQAVGLTIIAIFMLWAISTFGRNFEPSLQENRPRPNEGVRRSARFSLIFGGLNALTVILALGTLISLGIKTASATQIWLTIGFIGAMYGISRGIRFGGGACIYHWTLRAILAHRGHTPYRYQRFLHDAENRILLRRIGNGYAFPHRLLQEHLNASAADLLARLSLGTDNGSG